MIKNKKTKRSSHPVMFFIYVSLLVIIISGIANLLNFQVTYDKLTTISGEVSTTTVAVNSLLSLDGLKFLLTSAYDNLVEFIPFGTLLIASIALGIAINSGFLKTLCSRLNKKFPKFLLVFLYSLICIISAIDNSLGYVILLPIGALLFMSMNRNPIGGLALGFCSVAAGHGAGLFITSLDYNLSSYTEASAKLLDGEYIVSQGSNLIFIIVLSLLTAIIFTFITEKILVRRLGRNQIEEEEEFVLDDKDEKKGLLWAFISTIILLIIIVIMIIPSNSNEFVGLLLDKSQSEYSKMLFSSDALFIPNLVGIVSFILAVQSFVYGVVSGTIRKIRDMVNFSTNYLKKIGCMFVLIFFAAQLCAILKETNLGTVVTAFFANVIASSNFSFLPLILIVLIFTMIANIILPSSVSKWAILSPNIMPAIMRANVTPEFAQLVFRAGDSITNCITPIFSFFVIFIGFVEIYTKNKNDFGIRGCYRAVLPYFITIALIWLIMLICWYIIGLPIGIGIYPTV